MTHGKLAKSGPSTEMAASPLFIVSMWRSGSSLLYALLNKHPQVGLMFEADLALLQPLFLKPGSQRDWPRRWEFWNQALTRHQLPVADGPPGITGFHEAFTLVHQQYARRKGATIWGDKSPNYYDRLNEIADIFPDARFIIVWRDPTDTISSMLQAGKLGSVYFGRTGSALRGLLGCRILKLQCERLVSRGKPVLQLHYEDLVNRTAAVMREVCGFLEIPYTGELCDLQGADRSAISDHGARHHALVKGDQIVSGPRPDAISPALRRKITRYLAWWLSLYRGVWPASAHVSMPGQSGPGRWERILDEFAYRVLRSYDGLTALAFCFLPVFLLSKYRARKYGPDDSRTAWRSDAVHAGVRCEVNNL